MLTLVTKPDPNRVETPIYYVPLPVIDGQFYVRDLNRVLTKKSLVEIMETCQPGHWEHTSNGMPYFVKESIAVKSARRQGIKMAIDCINAHFQAEIDEDSMEQ